MLRAPRHISTTGNMDNHRETCQEGYCSISVLKEKCGDISHRLESVVGGDIREGGGGTGID